MAYLELLNDSVNDINLNKKVTVMIFTEGAILVKEFNRIDNLPIRVS